MPSSFKPTAAGLRKYREAGGFYQLHEADGAHFPCHCETTCLEDCSGECGCFACRVAAVDRKSAAALRLLRES